MTIDMVIGAAALAVWQIAGGFVFRRMALALGMPCSRWAVSSLAYDLTWPIWLLLFLLGNRRPKG